MSITIELPTKTEAKLRKLAERKGQNLEFFVNQIVEREVSLQPVSLAEAILPLHEWTRSQGYTEEEIEELVDETIAEVRRETPLSTR